MYATILVTKIHTSTEHLQSFNFVWHKVIDGEHSEKVTVVVKQNKLVLNIALWQGA